MKKFIALTLSLLFFSSYAFASPNKWVGKGIIFYVTNNTAVALTVAPGWGGAGSIPKITFPKGDTIQPNSTGFYSIGAVDNNFKDSLGHLQTGIFLANSSKLVSVCDSDILTEEHGAQQTLEIDDFPLDGLYVGTKNANFSCAGQTTNFSNGTLHLTINQS